MPRHARTADPLNPPAQDPGRGSRQEPPPPFQRTDVFNPNSCPWSLPNLWERAPTTTESRPGCPWPGRKDAPVTPDRSCHHWGRGSHDPPPSLASPPGRALRGGWTQAGSGWRRSYCRVQCWTALLGWRWPQHRPLNQPLSRLQPAGGTWQRWLPWGDPFQWRAGLLWSPDGPSKSTSSPTWRITVSCFR